MPWWNFTKSKKKTTSVSRYLPLNKHDMATVELAKTIGFPALNPNIPQYLEWLQDGNWPVSWPMSELLVEAGPEIIPHIIDILHGDDEGWKYFLISGLIRNIKKMKPELFEQLRPEILRILDNPTRGEIGEHVHEMAVYCLEDDQSLPFWINWKSYLRTHGVPNEFIQALVDVNQVTGLQSYALLPSTFYFKTNSPFLNFEFLTGYEIIPVFETPSPVRHWVLLKDDKSHKFARLPWTDNELERDHGPNFMAMLADLLIDYYAAVDELGLDQLVKNGEALGFERSAELFQAVDKIHNSGTVINEDWRTRLIQELTD